MGLDISILKVKKISDCERLATVDAYDDHEVATGWMTCLDEVFEDVKTVKILGHEVTFTGFDIEPYNAVVGTCKSGKKTARVSLQSIEWPKLNKVQQVWLKAWTQYAGNN